MRCVSWFAVVIVHALLLVATHALTPRRKTQLRKFIGAQDAIQDALSAGKTFQIPQQLVFTSKYSSLEDTPAAMQKNVKHTMSLNPELEVRWFADSDCHDYLAKHFDKELVRIFDSEEQGNYRGDLCRAAVLAKEGGFYSDLDVEWKFPMRELVDGDTTFMSAISPVNGGEMLNALIAASPGNALLGATLAEVKKWYRNATVHQGWMGPMTLLRGVQANCPDVALDQQVLDISCGSHKLKIYEQRHMRCTPDDLACPPVRAQGFDGVQYGIFHPESDNDVVAYPRYAECNSWGCNGGGWNHSKANI